MDSVKINLHEEQLPRMKNTPKPAIFPLNIIHALIVIGILAVTIVMNIRNFSQNSCIYLGPTDPQSIGGICSFTPYKSLCYSALSSSISAARTNISREDYISPENIIIVSFQLADTQLTYLASFFNFTKPEEVPETVPALQDCHVLLNKEVSQLNNSEVFRKELCSVTNDCANDYIERLNRIETYQQTCLDGLEMSGSTLIDEIRSNVEKSRRHINNTRAILLNINLILRNIHGSPSIDNNNYSYSYFFNWLYYEYLAILIFLYGMFHIFQCVSFLNIPRGENEDSNA